MQGKSNTVDQLSYHARLWSEKAQTMAEYAVVLGVITVAIVTTIGALSGASANLIQRVANLL
jgi:Flp pilus assembly pilin Flp